KALALIKKMSLAAWRHLHLQRALHLPRPRTAHRPGCDRGGARVGVTEFSGVWAYNPHPQRPAAVFSGPAARPALLRQGDLHPPGGLCRRGLPLEGSPDFSRRPLPPGALQGGAPSALAPRRPAPLVAALRAGAHALSQD